MRRALAVLLCACAPPTDSVSTPIPASAPASTSPPVPPAATATATATPPAAPPADPGLAGQTVEAYRRVQTLVAKGDGYDLTDRDVDFLVGLAAGEMPDAKRSEIADWGPQEIRRAWLGHMYWEARNGRASTIRMPITICIGYGCEVPSIYTAIGCFEPHVMFVDLQGFAAGDACLECWDHDDEDARAQCQERRGCDHLVVQGHFTGERSKASPTCEDSAYDFEVERSRNTPTPSPYSLGLPAGVAAPEGDPLPLDSPFAVVLTFPRTSKDPRKKADAAAEELRAAGHHDVQVVDSRLVPALWCCSWAVVAERFADNKRAQALAKRLRKHGFKSARTVDFR